MHKKRNDIFQITPISVVKNSSAEKQEKEKEEKTKMKVEEEGRKGQSRTKEPTLL